MSFAVFDRMRSLSPREKILSQKWQAYMQTLQSIWSDAERLSSLNYIFAWIGIGVMVFGVIITASSTLVGRRVDGLNKSQSAARERIIDAKFEPRTISTDKQLDFIKFLKGKPKGEIVVTTIAVDNDTRIFSTIIRDMLDRAGYGCGKYPRVIVGDPQQTGLISVVNPRPDISITVSGQLPEYAVAIKDAFERIGFTAGWSNWMPMNAANFPYDGKPTITIIERN